MKPVTIILFLGFQIWGLGAAKAPSPCFGLAGESVAFADDAAPVEAQAIATRVIELVDALEGRVAPADFSAVLLPIKKAAGWAWACNQAHSALSARSRASLEALAAALEKGSPFLEAESDVPVAAHAALELLEIRFRLARELGTSK